MFLLPWLIVSLLRISAVFANTETYTFHVPADFPREEEDYIPPVPFIDLSSTTFSSITVNVSADSVLSLDLFGLKNDESYSVRVCWSAIDPIEIKSIKYQIIPYNTEFNGISAGQPRNVLQIEIGSESYPQLVGMVPIDVNISLLKLGIPVDLYSVVIYLFLIVSCTLVFLKSTFLSQFLCTGDKKNV